MMNSFWMTLSSVLVLSSLLSLRSTSQTQHHIILKYDFENGDFSGVKRQYQDKTCSQSSDYINNSLFEIVDAPKGRTGQALKHHIQNCDERSELTTGSGFLKDGQSYWLGWSYFFPSNFITPNPGQPTFTIVQQMAYKNAWRDQIDGKTLFECNSKTVQGGVEKTIGVPGSELTIASDGKTYTYKLKYYKGKDSKGRYIFGCQKYTLPAQFNAWEDFVMNLNSSDNPNLGYFRLWKNGKLYIDEKVALSRPGIDSMGDWKIGAYIGDPNRGERILYTDELKVGNQHSSFNEVSPSARPLSKYSIFKGRSSQ